MSYLTDVTWRRNAAEAHTKSQDEPACEEHTPVDRWRLYAGPYNDDQGANEHTHAAAPVVVDRPSKKDRGYGTDIVDGKDDARGRSGGFPACVRDGSRVRIGGGIHVEKSQIRVHPVQSSHQ